MCCGLIAASGRAAISQQTTGTTAPAQVPAGNGPSATVNLTTPKGSGPAGQAILTQTGDDVQISLKLTQGANAATSSDAKIVHGACSTAMNSHPSGMTGGAAPSGASSNGNGDMQLSPVNNGSSQTTLQGMQLQQLLAGGYSIVVSQQPPLCGDLNTAKR